MRKDHGNQSVQSDVRDTVGSLGRRGRWILGIPLALSLSACAALTPAPRIFFQEPSTNATLTSPVKVKMGAEGFVLEPAGDIHAGAGHLHIMVDTGCITAGQPIPKDDTHIHYGKGQTEAELTLAPGTHTLCLQAANGTHIASDGPGMQHMIKVTVK